mmetsp:Transcript_97147/g.197355  ORF Transcript_97147/g.197355 Transcript_97147/m.197355 type:complete len:92 (+) Transcript_97147:1-276(+)
MRNKSSNIKNNKDIDGTNGKNTTGVAGIRTSMRSALVSSKRLRRGLIQLFDVDLNSLSGKSEELVSLAIDHRSNSSIKLRYLDHPDFFFLG